MDVSIQYLPIHRFEFGKNPVCILEFGFLHLKSDNFCIFIPFMQKSHLFPLSIFQPFPSQRELFAVVGKFLSCKGVVVCSLP